jgi:hypothetical protein
MKEREWWQERKIDPLTIAQALWQESQSRSGGVSEAANSKQVIAKPELPVDAALTRSSATGGKRDSNLTSPPRRFCLPYRYPEAAISSALTWYRSCLLAAGRSIRSYSLALTEIAYLLFFASMLANQCFDLVSTFGQG